MYAYSIVETRSCACMTLYIGSNAPLVMQQPGAAKDTRPWYWLGGLIKISEFGMKRSTKAYLINLGISNMP